LTRQLETLWRCSHDFSTGGMRCVYDAAPQITGESQWLTSPVLANIWRQGA
jgi:hypothetical protein